MSKGSGGTRGTNSRTAHKNKNNLKEKYSYVVNTLNSGRVELSSLYGDSPFREMNFSNDTIIKELARDYNKKGQISNLNELYANVDIVSDLKNRGAQVKKIHSIKDDWFGNVTSYEIKYKNETFVVVDQKPNPKSKDAINLVSQNIWRAYKLKS